MKSLNTVRNILNDLNTMIETFNKDEPLAMTHEVSTVIGEGKHLMMLDLIDKMLTTHEEFAFVILTPSNSENFLSENIENVFENHGFIFDVPPTISSDQRNSGLERGEVLFLSWGSVIRLHEGDRYGAKNVLTATQKSGRQVLLIVDDFNLSISRHLAHDVNEHLRPLVTVNWSAVR